MKEVAMSDYDRDRDCGEGQDWEAWHDRMPGGPATLHVTGTLSCPTPGYEIELKREEPQGINQRDLLLRLTETKPTGAQPEVITPVTVEYTEETDPSYDTVSIVPGGPGGIPVREVS
jgi:hypothetical protein